MPVPTLRKNNGRALPSDRRAIVGYPEYAFRTAYLPSTPKTPNYAQFHKTESVFSDKAVIASTDAYIPTNLHNGLSESFPSIHAARKTLSVACKSMRLPEYLAAAEIFLYCVTTVVDQMRDLPNCDQADPQFLSTMSSLVSVGGHFVASISNLKSVQGHLKGRPLEDMLNESYEFVKSLCRSMSDLLGAAIRTTFKTKPLPELPPGVTLRVVEESQSSLESPSSTSSFSFSEHVYELTSLIDIHVSKDKDSKPLKHKITWQIPKRSRTVSSSKPSIFSFKSLRSLTSRSSAALVQPDVVKLSCCADIEPCSAISYDNSVFFYPNHPLNLESDVEMPMPTGEAAALSFDAEGRIKGGSLPALVAVLTSRHGVTDHELATAMYTYFRCFTTPALFFQELAKRYEEPQPTDLTDDQARFWETHISMVRIRVAQAMLDWLEQYWRTESDDEILEDMQIFAEERVEMPGHPKAIFQRVVEKINHMKQISPEDALVKRTQELVAQVELKMPQELPSPTGFNFPERFSRDLVVQLEQFNNPAGREEFARQLAVKLSGMFRDVDPVDAVAFWRLSQKTQKNDTIVNSAASKAIKAITMFESSLSIWVSYSIIKPKEPLDRVRMASFWLDIAIICLRLRNFNSASCIFGGVAHSSVTRMKETILNIPIASKAQFRHLDRFFSGFGNYSQYREAMERTMTPTLPLTVPLVRDIIVADILPSLADEENRTRADEGGQAQCAATGTGHVHLAGYRIMVQTIRTLDNYLIPYKFNKNEHFQTWLDAQLSRFTFSNSEEAESIYQDIYNRSNKREPKNQELQFVDVWEHTISGSLDGPYTITRCSEETLQFVPKEQPGKGIIRSLLNYKKSA